MIHGDDKAKEMARSILPSRSRKGQAYRASIHRSMRVRGATARHALHFQSEGQRRSGCEPLRGCRAAVCDPARVRGRPLPPRSRLPGAIALRAGSTNEGMQRPAMARMFGHLHRAKCGDVQLGQREDVSISLPLALCLSRRRRGAVQRRAQLRTAPRDTRRRFRVHLRRRVRRVGTHLRTLKFSAAD